MKITIDTAVRFMEEYVALTKKYGIEIDEGCGCCTDDHVEKYNWRDYPDMTELVWNQESKKIIEGWEDIPDEF